MGTFGADFEEACTVTPSPKSTSKEAGSAPRARVFPECGGYTVLVDGQEPFHRIRWTHAEALDYANLCVKLRRREWYARGCKKCHGRGQIPDWQDWNRAYGEPRPKPCPACQPETR